MNALFDEHQALGNQVTDETVQQLKTLGLYEEYKKKHLNNELNEIQGLLKLKRKQEINSIEYPNPLDEFPDLTDNLISLNIAEEQQKDTNIRTVTNWIQQNNQQPDLKYASTNLKKYYKHLNRLILEGNVLYRMILEKYFINNSVYLSICGKKLYTGSIIHKQQVI